MEASSVRRPLRFLLLGMLRRVLRWRGRRLELSPGTTLVVIAPHPDDETFGCGLLLAHPPATGIERHVVFLTRGEASHAGHPALSPGELARRRTGEAGDAARRLGLPASALHFLDLPDGRLGQLDSAADDDRIAALLDRLRPDVVLVPDERDGSSEHAATARLAARLARRPGTTWRRLAYLVWAAWSPRLLIRIACGRGPVRLHHVAGGAADKGRAAGAYRSQTESVAPWTRPVLPEDFVAALARDDEFFLPLDN